MELRSYVSQLRNSVPGTNARPPSTGAPGSEARNRVASGDLVVEDPHSARRFNDIDREFVALRRVSSAKRCLAPFSDTKVSLLGIFDLLNISYINFTIKFSLVINECLFFHYPHRFS